LAYTFGKYGHREQDSPIDLLKTRRFMRPLVRVFDTNSFGNIDSGEINTSLKPEIGWNYELGLKLHGLNNKLYTELTFFSTQITNLLVARRTAEDQYIGINAGVSSHIDGISLNYQLLQTSQFKLSSYFSAAVNRFTFKDFIDGDNNYSGNKLTGVPMHNGT
jgi:iron complex outermembrane receptor protein